MNEEKINQILKNQSRILSIISSIDSESLGETINRIDETQDLLNPPEEIPIADKTEPFFGNDALSQKTEVKKHE